MEELQQAFEAALHLGGDNKDITSLQMGLRAFVVYLVTLAIVRLGKKRFMGRATAFDVILGIMLGSIVSRAVTGNSPFFPTLFAAAVLMTLHWGFSWAAMHSELFGRAIKGRRRLLIRDGELVQEQLRAAHLTERDLWEALREKGIAELRDVQEVRLERNGELSVIRS